MCIISLNRFVPVFISLTACKTPSSKAGNQQAVKLELSSL